MSSDEPAQTSPQRLSSGEEVLALLKEKFPKTFFNHPRDIRPLKINIHLDIRQALGDVCSNKAIERALKLYAKQPAYYSLLKLNAQRIDLEGNLCGEVTDEHIQFAKDAKEKIKHLKLQRKKTQVEFPDDLSPSVRGRLELTLKINMLPQDVTFINGMNQFLVLVDSRPIRVCLRNKSWVKIEKAPSEYSAWIALIRGKIGATLEENQGFEMIDPVVQIFERKSTSEDAAPPKKFTKPSSVNRPSVNVRTRSPARGQTTQPVVIGVKKKFEGVMQDMPDVPSPTDMPPSSVKRTLTLKKKT